MIENKTAVNPLQNFPFVLAPMAELSIPPLRSLICSLAPETIVYTEMLSANLLLHGGLFNNALIKKRSNEKTVFQLLGREPAMIHDAAQALEPLLPFGIDINMGCSAPDMLKMKEGAALLKEKEHARLIIRSLRNAVKCPISVKIRAGFEKLDEAFTLDFCRMIQDEGASWITIHPRYAKQGFRALADWTIIKKVSESIDIPVIGNGDIPSAESAADRIKNGFCRTVMIGRTAVQKPWIFAECGNKLTGASPAKSIMLSDIAAAVLDGIRNELPPELHESRAKRFLFYFTKNFMFGHSLFTEVRNSEDIEFMKERVAAYCGRNPGESSVTV